MVLGVGCASRQCLVVVGRRLEGRRVLLRVFMPSGRGMLAAIMAARGYGSAASGIAGGCVIVIGTSMVCARRGREQGGKLSRSCPS